MGDSFNGEKEYGAVQCDTNNNCKQTVDNHEMDNMRKRDTTEDYKYPKYMDEENVKYKFIKELKEYQVDYGNVITNLNSTQSELNSVNNLIVHAKSSQIKDTLELKRNKIKVKITEKEKRLDDILMQMDNITNGSEFKGSYGSFLDTSNKTVDQIFKKSDDLQANIDSFNITATDYQTKQGIFTDLNLKLQSNRLFYQTWIFMAILSIIVVVMHNKAPTKIILLVIGLYILYVLFNFHYLITSWISNLL